MASQGVFSKGDKVKYLEYVELKKKLDSIIPEGDFKYYHERFFHNKDEAYQRMKERNLARYHAKKDDPEFKKACSDSRKKYYHRKKAEREAKIKQEDEMKKLSIKCESEESEEASESEVESVVSIKPKEESSSEEEEVEEVVNPPMVRHRSVFLF